MTYRDNKKARKLWSEQANTKKERLRLDEAVEVAPYIELDPYIKITIERTATNEKAVFECFEGTRIDNYRVYCNDKFQGVQSISILTKNIRKALPRFRRIND
jgi:hypothetical protein